MGKADVAIRRYMGDPARFADAFNYAIYDGEHVIDSAGLRPLDSVSVFSLPGRRGRPIERRRDGLRMWSAMADGQATYALLGVENQTYVDASMPVRGMLYDALAYQDQVDELRRKNRDEGLLKGDALLSGMLVSDRLLPVVTLVVHFGQGEWDGQTSLHGLLSCRDKRLLNLVPDYRVNLLSPAGMADGDFTKFDTDLGIVLGYIKHAGDKDGLRDFVMGDGRFRNMDAESVRLVDMLTDSGIALGPGEETVDMCQAIQDIRQEGVDEGIQQGIQQGMLKTLAGLVEDGMLTLEDAAKRAGLSVGEFSARLASL